MKRPVALVFLLGCSINFMWAAAASVAIVDEGNENVVGLDLEYSHKTGSFRNCTISPDDEERKKQSSSSHPDSSYVTVSCNHIHYRIPSRSLTKINAPQNRRYQRIIVGVLSGAAVPERRMSIRSTWGYAKPNIFFIVGGPWKDILEEYEEYGDLLWIDREEIYITETSVLTLKTEAFLSIMYGRLMLEKTTMVEYLFKTDDDSYVNLEKLYNTLLSNEESGGKKSQANEESEPFSSSAIDYWGKCNEGGWKPHRNQEIEWQKKWYISYETYAEPEYPPFCQGAGYALSKKFLDCAVGENHIANVKYMPNEDVAVGMLAERCNVVPVNDDEVWIRWKGPITMKEKIVQHYVKSEEDMRLHHQSATGVKGPILVL